jgi:hypothetical protein
MDSVDIKNQPVFKNYSKRSIIVYTRGVFTSRSLDTNLTEQDCLTIIDAVNFFKQTDDSCLGDIENVSIIKRLDTAGRNLASEFCDSNQWTAHIVKQDSLIMFILDKNEFLKTHNPNKSKLRTLFITHDYLVKTAVHSPTRSSTKVAKQFA